MFSTRCARFTNLQIGLKPAKSLPPALIEGARPARAEPRNKRRADGTGSGVTSQKPHVQVALQTAPTIQPSPPVAHGRFSYDYLSHNQKQLARSVWYGLASVYANKPLLHPMLSKNYIQYVKAGATPTLNVCVIYFKTLPQQFVREETIQRTLFRYRPILAGWIRKHMCWTSPLYIKFKKWEGKPEGSRKRTLRESRASNTIKESAKSGL